MNRKEILKLIQAKKIHIDEGVKLYSELVQNSAEKIDRNTCITIESPGYVDDLKLTPVNPREPEDDEIQIEVRACSLNFGDLLCVKGLYPTMPSYPFTPGFEVAGLAVKVGKAVKRIKAGDPVISIMGPDMGGHSGNVTVKEGWAVKKPDILTFEEACSLPITFLTVYHVFDTIKPQRGEKILIQTAAGGTGLTAVQLAMHAGAEIYATAGSDEKLKFLKDMGITNLINYREDDFYSKVMEMTDGQGVDIVLNTLPGEAIQKGINLLGPGGRYVEIAMTGLKSSSPINMAHMVDNQSFLSVDLRKFLMKKQELATKYLDIMVEYVERGIIKPIISKVFKSSEIKQAYKCLEDRRNIGKLVISIPEQISLVEPVKHDQEKTFNKFNGETPKTMDIAVIGMSARFPRSPDIRKFWENLAGGEDLITEVPGERWDWRDYYHPDPDNLEKTNCKWGGFIENADLFDPSFFKISGREAEVTDPQQRIFLEECWNALEDAGYASDTIDSKNCGIFAGAGGGDYLARLRKNNVDRVPQSFWGNESSVIPARIAYFLNLKGPAVSINTACSSSLVAIHLACQSILAGDCNMALAGGIFICTTPEFYILSSNANMLSPDGRCKAFDNSANGFVPGEGAGVIMLKRLDEALKDGDHIYGVIKGSSINQDGRTNGITAPNSLSQTNLLTSVYKKFGINPETISYIEAHGTGTELGDPIEVGALTKAFSKFTSRKNYCWLGSVKTNMGHAVSAAGVASVIKVLLALKHGFLPPILHFNELNKHISFEDTPFKVNTNLQEWKSDNGKPRRAGVSSFGFSGTNAHIVIEEPPAKSNLIDIQNPYYFIPISAKSEQALKNYVENLYKWLESSDFDESIENIAYTLLVRRAHFPFRAAIIASDTKDLIKKLHILCSSDEEMYSHSNIKRDKTSSHNQNLVNYANKLLNEMNLFSLNKNTISEKQYLEKLSAISEFYIKQYPVDWTSLYKECGYSNISMPTYPFQRFSYWTPTKLEGIHKDESSLMPEKTSVLGKDILAYYRPEWIEDQPLDLKQNKKHVKRIICIFGVDDDLYQTTRDLGNCPLIRVVPGDGFRKVDTNTFVINPGKAEDYICLVNELKSEDMLPSDILYAWAGMTQVNTGFKKNIGDELLEQFNSLAYIAKAFMKAATGLPLNLTYICRGNASVLCPLTHGLTAFFRTLHIENPLYRFRSVQLPAIDTEEQITEYIGYEMDTAVTAGEEISYVDGKRMVRKLVRHVSKSLEDRQAFRSNGIYWIAGGAGGIGSILVRYLVEKFDATVYISGRSDKPKNIENIKGKLFYIKGDVSEKGEAKRIYDCIILESGSLNGVINLAGIIKDKYLVNKSAEDINAVLAPKYWGTYYLDEAAANEKLDFFLAFSSIVSFTGNSGQSDYSFANGFIDGYMHMRNDLCSKGERWGKSISINWPVWVDGGMKLTTQAGKNMREVLGLQPLSALHGINALENCIQSGLTQLLVIYGDNSKFESLFDGGMKVYEENTDTRDETENYQEHPEQAVLLKWAEDYLKNIFAEVLRIAPGSFEVTTPFEDLGMDSLIVKNVNTKLEESLGTLPKTLLFERSNIKALAEYLVENNDSQLLNAFNKANKHKMAIPTEKMEQIPETNIKHCACDSNVDGDIAIIGMSARLPQAEDINEFWENLKTGKDCITEIPRDRWDYRDYYHPDPELAEQGKIYCKWGGFIEDISSFDTLFFNIPPQKAELMDPQERLLLQTSWLALEDSGYNPREFSKKYLVGVFAGVTTHSYQLWGPGEWQKGNYIFPESSAWSLANRISYFFDFKGPSIPVDTACSSSLTAVHEACASIKRGECEVALVGGVNLYLHPSKYIGLCQMHMLSKDGRCKSFAEGADGFVPGEGVAAVVLKPLSKAIKDKDNIYAVIKGSSVNHGGRTNGYTVPNPDSQAELICRAFKDGNIEPLSVTAIEAHGTGTALGDPIEIRGLAKAFGNSPKPYCSISSSKSNIGHLEGAAGITGIIKMALQLKNKQLVPTLHVKKLNKDIPFEGSPFFIQKELADWERQVFNTEDGVCEYPRRGGISSFGAGGANAHVILEEYTTIEEPDKNSLPNDPILVVLSAKTSESLNGNCKKLYKYLEKKTGSRQSSISGKEELYESLKVMTAEIIGVKPEDILQGELFEDLGMDAVNLSLLLDRINNAYNADIKINELLKCKCLLEVAEEIYRKHLLKVSPDRADIPALGDIAYTLQVGREHMEERVAFVVSSVEDLISQLELFTSTGIENDGIYRGTTSGYKAPANNTNFQLLMENKDYHALARLWTSGSDIDWEAFNTGSKYRRVPLPGYSFAPEHYWMPVKHDKTVISETDKSSGLNGLLPTNKPENEEYIYTVELSRDEFYIKDHVVSGNAVMPASAYLN
ncbi:MAG TPA: SDR family NAD(P)-dependent oxidoreductase, partial [Ruminiclostridium sp.]|nr:SDR family NAD(P)-dependent oxidoreductase [Ruminiclostridium sp.]